MAADTYNWTDFSSEIDEVRLAELEPSPFQTRVIRKDDALRELAESIKRAGVQQPIVYRQVWLEGDVTRFEIVTGHRRVKASEMAGLETIPAICRDLTDDEARAIQIAENLHRENLGPLEEARAYRESAALGTGCTPTELALRIGKPPAYVHTRLKLLEAIAPVQEALSARLIDVGHALELARLAPGEQGRLLRWLGIQVPEASLKGAEIKCDGCGDPIEGQVYRDAEGEPYCKDCFDDDPYAQEEEDETVPAFEPQKATLKSVGELRRHIAATCLRVLEEATFDPADAGLVPEAGSCADCLKRTGSSPSLFFDVRGDDICTDRACFEAKTDAALARRIQAAKGAKDALLQLTQHYSHRSAEKLYVYDVEVVKEPCERAEAAIRVDGDNKGQMVSICRDKRCKVHGEGGTGSGGRSNVASGRNAQEDAKEEAKRKEERRALLAKVEKEKQYRLALFKALLAKPVPPAPTDEMVKSLAAFALGKVDSTKHEILAQSLGVHKDTFGWQSRAKGPLAFLMPMSQGEALRAALVALEAHELTVHEYDVDHWEPMELGLERAAKMLGVDPKQFRGKGTEGLGTEAKAAAKKARAKKVSAKKAAAKKSAAKKAAKKAAQR